MAKIRQGWIPILCLMLALVSKSNQSIGNIDFELEKMSSQTVKGTFLGHVSEFIDQADCAVLLNGQCLVFVGFENGKVISKDYCLDGDYVEYHPFSNGICVVTKKENSMKAQFLKLTRNISGFEVTQLSSFGKRDLYIVDQYHAHYPQQDLMIFESKDNKALFIFDPVSNTCNELPLNYPERFFESLYSFDGRYLAKYDLKKSNEERGYQLVEIERHKANLQKEAIDFAVTKQNAMYLIKGLD